MYQLATLANAPKPQRAFVTRLSSIWVFAPLTAAVTYIMYFAYVSVISDYIGFSAAGFFDYPPRRYAVPIAFAFALVPVVWLRRRLSAPSDLCMLYLYFFVYIPSCVLMPVATNESLRTQVLFLSALLAAFGASELRRLYRPALLPQAQADRMGSYTAALAALTAIGCAILLYFGDINLTNIQFFDVYERRQVLLGSQSAWSTVTFYTANWLSLGLVPLLLAFSIHRRHYALAALALIAALLGFAATSFKTHLYLPLMAAAFYVLIRRIGYRQVGVAVLITVIVLTLGSVVWDALFNDIPVATWTLQFRFTGNNGYLSVKYFDFFHYRPKGLFADTFGRLLFESPYNVPLAQMVGESLGGLRGNHANAHLWADGFANLGFPGLFFATAELVAFFWILDSVSYRKNIYIVTPALLACSFSLANTSVHTMLSSNGGVFLLLLIALLPQEPTWRAHPS